MHCAEPLAAFREIGVKLVDDYPKCSHDLNAIENAWKILRERLYDTLPAAVESREGFTNRLKNAVRWINANKRTELSYLCGNQKERARDLIELGGARTKW